MTLSNSVENEPAHFSCLIVEDEASFAAMAAKIVREEGGEPTSAPTISAAREALSSRAFDLVLLDNHLPDGKGYVFFEQIARRNPEAPIIMITGVPDLAEAV